MEKQALVQKSVMLLDFLEILIKDIKAIAPPAIEAKQFETLRTIIIDKFVFLKDRINTKKECLSFSIEIVKKANKMIEDFEVIKNASIKDEATLVLYKHLFRVFNLALPPIENTLLTRVALKFTAFESIDDLNKYIGCQAEFYFDFFSKKYLSAQGILSKNTKSISTVTSPTVTQVSNIELIEKPPLLLEEKDDFNDFVATEGLPIISESARSIRDSNQDGEKNYEEEGASFLNRVFAFGLYYLFPSPEDYVNTEDSAVNNTVESLDVVPDPLKNNTNHIITILNEEKLLADKNNKAEIDIVNANAIAAGTSKIENVLQSHAALESNANDNYQVIEKLLNKKIENINEIGNEYLHCIMSAHSVKKPLLSDKAELILEKLEKDIHLLTANNCFIILKDESKEKLNSLQGDKKILANFVKKFDDENRLPYNYQVAAVLNLSSLQNTAWKNFDNNKQELIKDFNENILINRAKQKLVTLDNEVDKLTICVDKFTDLMETSTRLITKIADFRQTTRLHVKTEAEQIAELIDKLLKGARKAMSSYFLIFKNTKPSQKIINELEKQKENLFEQSKMTAFTDSVSFKQTIHKAAKVVENAKGCFLLKGKSAQSTCNRIEEKAQAIKTKTTPRISSPAV